ncbi:MAG TPA: hypothetical protein VMW18_13130 [Candidatus Binatia bacterium]|nr:hypothetical protein [Candidatus Binatia bacterium]
MDRNRNDKRGGNRIPRGLNFLMWPALVRAPWLIGACLDGEDDRSQEANLRRKRGR